MGYRLISRWLSKLLLILVLIHVVYLTFPFEVRAELHTITVSVEPKKANEKEWDMSKGAPDLALCMTHPLVGVLCLPNGDSIEAIKQPECPNSYQCRFSAEIPEQTFKVSIVDVDVAFNDVIGVGHCRRGETCEVGQAIVTISQ